MKNLRQKQKGGAILTLIVLLLLGYGIWISIQYVPQVIESKAIESIFDTMRTDQGVEAIQTEGEAKAKVIRLLQINEMSEMAKNLKVSRGADTINVRISYDRELNLGFKVQPMHYEKILELMK